MPKLLRIAIVTDIHYGPTPDGETKRGMRAPELLERVIPEIAAHDPDLFVDMGDRLSDVSPEEDRTRLETLADHFDRIPARREHLQGNHDIPHLTADETAAILGRPIGHRSMDIAGWHLIFWDADPEYPGGLEIAEGDFAWLERELADTALPTVVFSHVPLGGGSMLGNYYFEDRPYGRAGHVNADRARAIFETAGTVVLAVAGHVHWNSLNTIDGTHYVTIQSLTESFTSTPEPAAAWAVLELEDHEIRVRVHGNDPWRVALPRKRVGAHWPKRPPRAPVERA